MIVQEAMPKYRMIKEEICRYIQDRGLQAGDRLPTERELCEMFAVSRITTQRALHELQDENIIYRVQGGGTYVSGNNQEEKDSKTNYIPLIMSNMDETFRFQEVIRGAEDYLQGKSCYITVHTNDTQGIGAPFIEAVSDQGSQCAIIMPSASHIDGQIYFNMIKNGMQLVFIDIKPYGVNANSVTSDNIYGGYIATRHLLEQGYRRIATTSMPPYTANTISDRLRGYRLALEEYGIACREDYVFYFEGFRPLEAYLDDILSIPNGPNAIFAINDIIAIKLSNICVRRGIRIPEDIAIIGYDNTPAGASLPTPLSTIDQDFYQLGFQAARLAYGKMCRDRLVGFQNVILPVKLIARESTALKK